MMDQPIANLGELRPAGLVSRVEYLVEVGAYTSVPLVLRLSVADRGVQGKYCFRIEADLAQACRGKARAVMLALL